jgi:hypothetical protein
VATLKLSPQRRKAPCAPERAPEPKRFVLVEGGSHLNNNALALAQYKSALAELFGLRH